MRALQILGQGSVKVPGQRVNFSPSRSLASRELMLPPLNPMTLRYTWNEFVKITLENKRSEVIWGWGETSPGRPLDGMVTTVVWVTLTPWQPQPGRMVGPRGEETQKFPGRSLSSSELIWGLLTSEMPFSRGSSRVTASSPSSGKG